MARPAVRVALEGDKEMLAKLTRVAGDQGMRKEARAATVFVGGEKLEIARERAPEKSGRLKRSARLLVLVSPKKEEIRISLVFGGASRGVLYAAKVHETHPTHAKYLESTILEAAGTAGQEIADRIDLRRAAGA